MAKKRRYWLFKSEPDVYGIEDLEKEGSCYWEGVRNYQARNFMRDDMKIGDAVLYYHSNAKPTGIVGLARVCKEAYPDFTQFDLDHKYYDPKAKEDDPRWMMVDIEFVARFDHILPLKDLKGNPDLDGMPLLRKGMRLSIQPVERQHWDVICDLAGYEDR